MLHVSLLIKSYLTNRGRNVPNFKNDLHDGNWACAFLKRNHSTNCLSENMTRKCAEISSESLPNYFANIKNELGSVWSNPRNIWNYNKNNFPEFVALASPSNLYFQQYKIITLILYITSFTFHFTFRLQQNRSKANTWCTWYCSTTD